MLRNANWWNPGLQQAEESQTTRNCFLRTNHWHLTWWKHLWHYYGLNQRTLANGHSMVQHTNGLPCRFCNGSVMMPPAAAAATSPWMLVRFAVGRVRTSPCWPPSCPAMLKGMRMGWLRVGGPPGITPATAEANCCAVRSGCNKTEAHSSLSSRLLKCFPTTEIGPESSKTIAEGNMLFQKI